MVLTVQLCYIEVLMHKGEFKKGFSYKLNLPVKGSRLGVGPLCTESSSPPLFM